MRRIKWVAGGLIGFFMVFAIVVSLGGDDVVDSGFSEAGHSRIRQLCEGAERGEGPVLSPAELELACEQVADQWVDFANVCDISEANVVDALVAAVDDEDGGLRLARVMRSSGCPRLEVPGLEQVGSTQSP